MPFGIALAVGAGLGLISTMEQSNAIENAATQQGIAAAQANETTKEAQSEASRQFDISRADALKLYDQSREDALRQYGTNREDALRLYNESRGDANRQFDLSRNDTIERYNQGRNDLAPWRDAGGLAVGELANLMQPGGLLRQRFTLEDFENDPVNKKAFEFGLSEGEKAVQRMFGARGMGRSGAAIKAATRFAEDYAGSKAGESRARFIQDQESLYNRLAGVAGTGQNASTGSAQLGAQASAQLGSMGSQNSALLANMGGQNAALLGNLGSQNSSLLGNLGSQSSALRGNLGAQYSALLSNNANVIGNNIVGAGNARGAAAIAQGNAFAGGVNNAATALYLGPALRRYTMADYNSTGMTADNAGFLGW